MGFGIIQATLFPYGIHAGNVFSSSYNNRSRVPRTQTKRILMVRCMAECKLKKYEKQNCIFQIKKLAIKDPHPTALADEIN